MGYFIILKTAVQVLTFASNNYNEVPDVMGTCSALFVIKRFILKYQLF